MKRRQVEREMDEREEAEMRRKKEEADRLFLLYQREKDKQRAENSQNTSQYHLKQIVSFLLSVFSIVTGS